MYELLNYLNNFFVKTFEISALTFDSAGKTISGIAETYLEGQYILIEDTVLNDGVYKITDITAGVITVAEALQDETNTAYAWGLAIPSTVVALQTEIATFKAATDDGLASESQGSRSVSFKNGSSWSEVFKARLIPYRRLYSDKNAATCKNWRMR